MPQPASHPSPRQRIRRPRSLLGAICLLGLAPLALLAPGAGAQQGSDTGGHRPAGAGRVVRAFDFEEQDINPLPVPLGWIRAQEDPEVPRVRPGFPIWNGGVLDYTTPAYAGVGSVKLPTAGGSTSLVLRHGELNIFSDADYLVSARVRTQGLAHAKARVVATLLDGQGLPILGSQSASPLVRTQGDWRQVSLTVEGLYPQAAFMQLELQVLQPRQQYEQHAIRPFTVWEQDYSGAAWFDNLIIAQLPRLDITTGKPGNIVESDQPPQLQVLVRDLTGDKIVARVRVFDVHAHQVDDRVLVDGHQRVHRSWVPTLPGFGWYRALLEVAVDDQLVGIRTLDFIWASPLVNPPDSGMFSIAATLTDPRVAPSVPALVRGAGVTHASVLAWDYDTTAEDLAPASSPMRIIDELLDAGVGLSFTLAQLPRDLADALAIDPDEVLGVFVSASAQWTHWGASMLDHYGQRVSQWRFGLAPTLEPPSTLNPALDSARDALMGFVPGPVIVTPWAIDRPIEPALTRANQKLMVIDQGDTGEGAMGIVVDDWAALARSARAAPSDRPPMLGMSLRPPYAGDDWSGVEVWSTVGALARKAISFWWAASSSPIPDDRFDLQLQDAWWVSPGKRGQVMPAPELVVWRTLATHLGARHGLEELDLIPGVRMLVASARNSGRGPIVESDPADEQENPDDPTGALVLWLDEPTAAPITLTLPLALGPVTSFDVFNNKTVIPLSRVGNIDLPAHRITIGRSPIIIEGVNPELVRFLTNLRLTPDRLEARSGVHKHQLSITNPWPMPIQGRVYITEPGGYTGDAADIDRSWEINPRVLPFSLEPLETRLLPIDIAYSLGELAQPKALVFDVELQADTDYPLMRVERRIELGLTGIDMVLTARRNDAGITVVDARVVNSTGTRQDFEVIAVAPGEPRIRRTINALKPGQGASRQFAFAKANPGDQIVVALMLRDSSMRLNKAVTVP